MPDVWRYSTMWSISTGRIVREENSSMSLRRLRKARASDTKRAREYPGS
jgi:hypothetical protein